MSSVYALCLKLISSKSLSVDGVAVFVYPIIFPSQHPSLRQQLSKHWVSVCHRCCVFRHLFRPQLCADRQYHVAVVWSHIRTPKYMLSITTFGSNSKECLAVGVVKDLSSLVVMKFVRDG